MKITADATQVYQHSAITFDIDQYSHALFVEIISNE